MSKANLNNLLSISEESEIINEIFRGYQDLNNHL